MQLFLIQQYFVVYLVEGSFRFSWFRFGQYYFFLCDSIISKGMIFFFLGNLKWYCLYFVVFGVFFKKQRMRDLLLWWIFVNGRLFVDWVVIWMDLVRFGFQGFLWLLFFLFWVFLEGFISVFFEGILRLDDLRRKFKCFFSIFVFSATQRLCL